MPKNTQSISEKKLIAELVNVGLYPKPQYLISKMHVDIAFPEKMIAIEIDGPSHAKSKEKDKSRDHELEKRGWKVLRYPSKEAHDESEKLALKIKAEYEKIGTQNNKKEREQDRKRREKTPVEKIAYTEKVRFPWKLFFWLIIIGLILLLILNKFSA